MRLETIKIGRIVNAHGIRGEVRVQPWADSPDFLCQFKTLYVDSSHWPIQVERARVHKNMVILKFKEFNNINEIEKYKGKDLLIRRDQAVKLAPNENFITDLIGLKVVTDEGKEFGTLTDVLQTGANDVYVIESLEGKEYLFPAIPQCILDVNLESQMVTVHILDGLLDL